MEFGNSIVGGSDELVRDGIQSRGFVSGSSGWRVDRTGNAEFNDVTVRGELHVIKANDELIIGDPAFVNPAITAYKNGVAEPASILGVRPFGTGVTGWQIASANTPGHDRAILQLTEFGMDLLKTNTTWFGVDFQTAGIATVNNNGDPTWLPYVVDGKAYTGVTVDTNSASAVFVTVTSANAVNLPLIVGRAYRAHVRCRVAGSVLNDRVQFIVANGVSQLGQDYLHRITGAITTFVDVEFHVYWNEFIGGTVANLNLRMCRFSGTGTVTVRVEPSNYYIVVEEVGEPGLISGL